MNVQDVKFSFKEFLKRRRPEKFSDSSIRETGCLDRVVLEHFLSTLSTRNQELQFEDFAKKYVKKSFVLIFLNRQVLLLEAMVKLIHKPFLFQNKVNFFGSKGLMKHQTKSAGPLL
jgi:hypothetical protein